MILEIRRIDSASLQSLLEIFAAMKSLAAGRNLNSLKQQIKTICCPLRSSRSQGEFQADRFNRRSRPAGRANLLSSYREQPLPSMLEVPCWEFSNCLELHARAESHPLGHR